MSIAKDKKESPMKRWWEAICAGCAKPTGKVKRLFGMKPEQEAQMQTGPQESMISMPKDELIKSQKTQQDAPSLPSMQQNEQTPDPKSATASMSMPKRGLQVWTKAPSTHENVVINKWAPKDR